MRPSLRAIAFGVALHAIACGGSSGDTDAQVAEDPVGAGGASAGKAGASGSGTAGTSAAGTSAAGSATAGSGTSGSGTAGTGTAGSGTSGSATAGKAGAASQDLDMDGLDDAYEQMLATTYAPFFSVDPGDGCKLGGVLFRARPHPKDASLVHIVYVYLFENDCGLTGHVGDDEVSAVTVDPKKPAPAGIVAVRAISHQGTICEKQSNCGVCPGLDKCDVGKKNGQDYPVVYFSKDKHGSYVDKTSCALTCFDTCALAKDPAQPMMLNAGEPGHPLTQDLTKSGLITTANGWKAMELFGFNPWEAKKEFGGAGVVADDLVDPAFETPACSAP